MDARLVRDVMIGRAPGYALAIYCGDAYVPQSSQSRRLQWNNLPEEFTVSTQHLVRLCDAVIEGGIPGDCLDAIAFGLIADDNFIWDTDTPEGDRIGETLYDWSAPEINYALTLGTLAKFRHRLLTGEDTFTRADHGTSAA